jgi:hypothetical protein
MTGELKLKAHAQNRHVGLPGTYTPMAAGEFRRKEESRSRKAKGTGSPVPFGCYDASVYDLGFGFSAVEPAVNLGSFA